MDNWILKMGLVKMHMVNMPLKVSPCLSVPHL